MAKTPMYAQYSNLKNKYKDCILLFRLGDFYEAFEDDAKIISKVLGITLTGRGKGDNRIPMAGIPHHALKQYLNKLIHSSYKVAIADQLEPPETGKLVRRDVVKVITKGTVLDESMLLEYENNFLASIAFDKKSKLWGLAYCDISTGEFFVNEYSSNSNNKLPRPLIQELFRIRPVELLLSREFNDLKRGELPKFYIQVRENIDFGYEKNKRLLLEELKVANLRAFGIAEKVSIIIASGVLYQYLLETQKTNLNHIRKIQLLVDRDFVLLDENVIRDLELFYSFRGTSEFTLFSCLNNCKTSMGQRLLRAWLLRPLQSSALINERYTNVEELLVNNKLLEQITEKLDNIVDTQRLLSRLSTNSINARDLNYLKSSLESILVIFSFILNSETTSFKKIIPSQKIIEHIEEIVSLLHSSIKEDPPVTITEGNMIKQGFNKELDTLNSKVEEGRKFISELQESERRKTNIQNLKVSFNNVFGYYIEVSKSNISKIPENYIRKQTLVNAERFITEKLKYWEEIVLTAQTKASDLEYSIFEDIRRSIVERIEYIEHVNEKIALIDVFTNFANISIRYDLVKPQISTDDQFVTEVKNSRHIVVQSQLGQDFIPNDVSFIQSEQEQIVLTGPNMSGKSTYIRQIALLFIIAQIGCFVPADYAKLRLVDKIFTRVGSADNLAGGESTFMVEMNETANVLNNATSKSLIILDEVGRGTSTYDGLALAWAILEYIIKEVKARTLFATHYHELILLEDKFNSVKNFNVSVKEDDNEVVFMHKIERGASDRSYGIYVAQISGIPEIVIARAKDILQELEKEQLRNFKLPVIDYKQQLTLDAFTNNDSQYLEKLKKIDINTLTPLEALLKIKELQEYIPKTDK